MRVFATLVVAATAVYRGENVVNNATLSILDQRMRIEHEQEQLTHFQYYARVGYTRFLDALHELTAGGYGCSSGSTGASVSDSSCSNAEGHSSSEGSSGSSAQNKGQTNTACGDGYKCVAGGGFTNQGNCVCVKTPNATSAFFHPHFF